MRAVTIFSLLFWFLWGHAHAAGKKNNCSPPCTPCVQDRMEMSAGYNQAEWLLKDCPQDRFFGVDFLYWYSDEDGLSVGRRIPANRAAAAPTLHEQILLQDFSYQPGFKVFIGFANAPFDHWKVLAEWTRLHQTTSTHYAFDGTTQAILLESWIHLIAPDTFAREVHSSWKLHFDLLDLILSRPFFSGQRVTFEPLLGIRAAWIDQGFSIIYDFASMAPMDANFQSDSWGLGPLVGLIGNWKLGAGFSILGKASASLLYTSYTELKLFETIRNNFAASGVHADYSPYHTVRPNAGLGLGIAWAHYLCRGYHLDFSASYDFNVFWHQNMLRGISDNYSLGSSEAAISSLNLHGLTVEGCFHF